MNDLTQGSITAHILRMAAPLAVSMLTQMAYQLIDLYFVSKISVEATAGINAAGNVVFLVVALVQVLSVGTTALISQAIGRKNLGEANLIFNQAVVLSLICGAIITLVVYASKYLYVQTVAADGLTAAAGATFLLWMLPGFALTLPMATLSSALRASGVVAPTIAFYMLTVIINCILAPILIAGWGTGISLGVIGAGLATSISVALGLLALWIYFHRTQRRMTLVRNLMRPRPQHWGRILTIGLPAGGETALVFVYSAAVYYSIRHFGSHAQAGFGIGLRIMQTILLPGLSIGFAVCPIAGQNFGAQKGDRVREVFQKAALLGALVMLGTTVLVQWQPYALVGLFDADDAAASVAATFLHIVSWAFVAHGLVYTCSSMFQGLGNTMPSLISASMQISAFVVSLLWVSTQTTFEIEDVWYAWIGAIVVQTMASLWLLRAELNKRVQAPHWNYAIRKIANEQVRTTQRWKADKAGKR